MVTNPASNVTGPIGWRIQGRLQVNSDCVFSEGHRLITRRVMNYRFAVAKPLIKQRKWRELVTEKP
jgi:hypothetical protein